MQSASVLIAGIGNIFLGDDAFGVEVAQRMLQRPHQSGVRIVDFGIRGLDLAYSLLEEYRAVILVDAVLRGEAPGTLYVIEPDIMPQKLANQPSEMIDAHSMQPERVLQAALSMGAKLGKVVLIGCEPTPFDSELDMQMQLSLPVNTAVDEAIGMIDSIVKEILREQCPLIGIRAVSPETGCRQGVGL